MSKELKAVRGATTLDRDTPEDMGERLSELLDLIVEKNQIEPADIVNIFFTATTDISSTYPATAARLSCGWLADIPLLGAQEMEVKSGLSLCVRVLVQFYEVSPVKNKPPKDKSAQVIHCYLHGASDLRNRALKGNRPE